MLTLQSLVLQHQKRTNKTPETEPRYNTLTYKNTGTKALLEILQPKKHMEGGCAGKVRQWQKETKTTEL